jgi:hypothetical protein
MLESVNTGETPKETPKPSTTASNGGRKKNGRFAKGNKAAKGNPFARKVAHLRTVLLKSVTEDDLRAIVQKMLAAAKEGDLASAKMVFDYCIGRPAEMVNPDALEADEAELAKRRRKADPLSWE